MKYRSILILVCAMSLVAWGQESFLGKAPIWCGQVQNSYGYGDADRTTSAITNAPWKFSVDSVFVDTDGVGHYKKLGVGVQDAGDTTRAIPSRRIMGSLAAFGYFTFAGFRTSANDSGAFGIKPLCWSSLSKSWITSKNMSFDPYNSLGDTLLTTAVDSAGFAIERYLPKYCDSLKLVFTVKAIAGRSSDATKPTLLKRAGVCVY